MRFLVSLIIIFFLGTAAYSDKPIQVGVVVDPPWVMKTQSGYTGVAIDLWKEIALGLRRSFIFVERCCADMDTPFDNFHETGDDVLVGGLSVTNDRYKKVEFTLPIFIDKVVVVSPLNYFHSAFYFIKMLIVSVSWILAIFILLFALYINLLWYYEKSYARNFPTRYRDAISYIFWIHVLSGHHTEIPKSRGGKVVILSHKVLFYIIIFALNATLVSFLTVSLSHYAQPIHSMSDLLTHRVAAINDSDAYYLGREAGLKVIPVGSIQEAIRDMEAEKINAYLAELADVEYYFKENNISNFTTNQFTINNDLYAFGLPMESPLRREINEQILLLRSRGVFQKICKNYFSDGEKICEF